MSRRQARCGWQGSSRDLRAPSEVQELLAMKRCVQTDMLRADLGTFRAETNVRLIKIQDDLNDFHRSLGQHDKAIEILEKKRQEVAQGTHHLRIQEPGGLWEQDKQ